jgi:ribokinase
MPTTPCRHSRRECACDCRRCRSACACEGRHRGQPVRDSPARCWRLLRTRPCGGRNHDPHPAPAIDARRELLDLADIVILNESELGFLTKAELDDTDDHARFIEAARSLQTNADKIICVTLGKRGVLALVNDESLIIPGRSVRAVDTTGAGDCFVGAVAAQLARGNRIGDALDYANSAASICAQRMGAAPSMPTVAEVEAIISTSRPRERGRR